MSQSETHDTAPKAAAAAEARPAAPAFAPFAALVPLQLAQMEAMAKAAQSFMDGVAAINREMLAFADTRARALREGAKAPDAGQPMALWSQQLNHANSATQAYLQEAGKLFELGMKVSQDSWEPLQRSIAQQVTAQGRKD